MRVVKIISVIGVIAMSIALVNAFVNGDFQTEGSFIINNPWGIISLVDLYTGFILFSVWIAYRERKILPAVIWIFFMLTLGFFTGSIYMAYAAFTSNNDWKKFWLGNRSKTV